MKYRNYPHDPVLVRSDFHCVYCGKDLLADAEALITAVRDHLVPRSAGGPDGPENRVAACCACDRLKGGTVVSSVEEAREIIAGRRLGHEHWFGRLREALRPATILTDSLDLAEARP